MSDALSLLASQARLALLTDARSFELIETTVDDLVAQTPSSLASLAHLNVSTLPPSPIQAILSQHSGLSPASCIFLATIKEAEIARALTLCSPETVGRLYRLAKALKLPHKLPRDQVDGNLLASSLDEADCSFSLPTELGKMVVTLVPSSVAKHVCSDVIEIVPLVFDPPPCEVRVPGSKSVSNRALLLAGLSSGTCLLRGLLHSDDTQVMMAALEQLGASFVFGRDNAVEVRGNGGRFAKPTRPLYMGNAGTATRFIVSLCALIPEANHATRVTGSHRMLERPQGPLVDALRANGCKIRYEGDAGSVPLLVYGGGLAGGEMRMSGKISSQFVSSVLLAAPYARSPVVLTLDEANPTSISYIEMTLQTMAQFGVNVERLAVNQFKVPLGGYRAPREFQVEADASSATYPLAVAALTGRRVTVRGVGKQSLQGDAGFCHLLAKMGCRVEQTDETTTVTGPARGGLKPVEVDMGDLTDAFLTAAVVAAMAEGRSRFFGIANQHVKECDRIEAMCLELAKCGVRCENLPDGIVVHGRAQPEAFRACVVDTRDDHRIAMAFGVLGCVLPNICVQDKDCTDKTYPEFWDDVVRHFGGLRAPAPRALNWTDQTLVLVGMRGSGKSTLGKLAAAYLGFTFVDMDEVIVKESKLASCAAIVAARGWPGFRELETKLLKQTLASCPTRTVVACGGGVVETLEARWTLARHPLVVHIERDFEDIRALLEGSAPSPQKQPKVEDLSRPSLAEPLEQVWERRRPWLDRVSSRVFAVAAAGSEQRLTEMWPRVELAWKCFLDNCRRVATPDVLACRESGVVVVLKAPVAASLAIWHQEATPMPLIARGESLEQLLEAARAGVEAIELPPTFKAHQVSSLLWALPGPCRVETNLRVGPKSYPCVKVQPPAAAGAAAKLTRFYLFGHPISQSPSPTLHNTLFALLQQPHKAYELAEALDPNRLFILTKLPDFGGASVTIPHKEVFVSHVDELSAHAKQVGSVNTLVRVGKKLVGDNTDWKGIHDLLLPHRRQGGCLLVLGAGGTARAACYAAKQLNLDLVIYNRTVSRAHELATRFQGRALEALPERLEGLCAVVGTVPASAGQSVPLALLQAHKPVVLDAAYKPRVTALLADAAKTDCVCVTGLDLLLAQGFEQAKLFCGVPDVSPEIKARATQAVLEWVGG